VKIVFNTTQPHAPCSMFYSSALKGIPQITFHDLNIHNYDVALFMTYDHHIIQQVKQRFPNTKIGLIDPRNHKVYQSTKYCDFLIIDSIEMEDYWRISKKPLFTYVEYPNIPYLQKQHTEKDKITIGYHGNQIHLECMAETVTPALSELGKEYNLELLVMHNGKKPTGRESWYPDNVFVRHVPWSMENYSKELFKSDIGIVPNNLIHNTNSKIENKTNNNFNYSDDDYSLRFKMPSNPGRFVIFGKLNIPVVADFYPSAIKYLQGSNGAVACNTAGWYYQLKELINSSSMRQLRGDALQGLIREKFDFEIQNEKFINFLEKIVK